MLVEFKIWLDNEIEELKQIHTESNVFVWGKYAEAVRIRAMMMQIERELEKEREQDVQKDT